MKLQAPVRHPLCDCIVETEQVAESGSKNERSQIERLVLVGIVTMDESRFCCRLCCTCRGCFCRPSSSHLSGSSPSRLSGSSSTHPSSYVYCHLCCDRLYRLCDLSSLSSVVSVVVSVAFLFMGLTPPLPSFP